MTPFEKLYTNLNPEQRKAVDKTDGPVLVIAGPGTGKTSILTTRIGHILNQTDTAPENILCLTFTSAGVHSMRQKLFEIIGVAGHKVNIHTFHSFCGRVLRENSIYFGELDAEPADDIMKNEVMIKLFDQLDYDNVLIHARKDKYYYISGCLNIFQSMKRESWTVEQIEKGIYDYLEELKLDDDYYYKKNTAKNKKGDFNQNKFDKEAEKYVRTIEAVNLFPKYNKALKDNNSYDFADMIRWVLDAFEKHEELLLSYQEQFHYILLDEFQDTNGAQNNLVKHLASYWEEDPNLFIVGDDDQAIYGFQGARIENIVEFSDKYKENIEMVVLKSNYRSSQKILDASTKLINRNSNRSINKFEGMKLDKDIVAANPTYSTLEGIPTLLTYPQHLHEVVGNVQRIEALIKDGVEPEEIALLYRKHALADDYIKLFEAKGIPFSTKRPINILEHDFVLKILNLLAYIDLEFKSDQQGDYLLFEIMHYKTWGISARDISKIALYKAKNPIIEDVDNVSEDKQYLSFLEIIRNEEILANIDLEKPEALQQFLVSIDQLLIEYGDRNYFKFVEHVVNTAGFIEYALRQKEQKLYIDILTTFLAFVQKESSKKQILTKDIFFATLNMMAEHKIQLNLEKKLGSNKGVNLMTTHASKGLEFEYVFIIDSQEKNWEKRSARKSGIKLPPNLTKEDKDEELQSDRRLFFVAMTRAKKQIFISYPQADDKGKDLSRSLFVNELDESNAILIEEIEVNEDVLVQDQIVLLQNVAQDVQSIADKQELSWLLDRFKLTFSAMSAYLKCPISFYYDSLLAIPQPQSIQMAFGTSIHNTLDRFVKKYNKDKYTYTIEEILKIYEQELQKFTFSLTKEEMEQLTKLGIETLTTYLPKLKGELHTKIEVETAIEATLDNTPIKGILDKVIHLNDKDVIISDYKTGKSIKKTTKRSAKNEMGGDHWRQILFYKLLFESYHQKKKNMIGGEINYLVEDKLTKIIYTEDDEQWLTEIIIDTYNKITNLEFDQGCSEEDCRWCNFVKNN